MRQLPFAIGIHFFRCDLEKVIEIAPQSAADNL